MESHFLQRFHLDFKMRPISPSIRNKNRKIQYAKLNFRIPDGILPNKQTISCIKIEIQRQKAYKVA